MKSNADNRRKTKPKGRHPDKALSAAFCRTVTDPGRYCDGNGLYLQVDPTGARRWVQRLVVRGKSRALGLGSFSLVSLAEAREQARTNRRTARTGGDPLADRRRAQGVPTFEEAAGQVLAIHQAAWKESGGTLRFWKSTLRDYVYPHIGGKSVDQVTTADVMAVLLPIWTCVDASENASLFLKLSFCDQFAPAVLRDSGAAPQRRDCSRGTRASLLAGLQGLPARSAVAVTRRAATEWRSRAAA